MVESVESVLEASEDLILQLGRRSIQYWITRERSFECVRISLSELFLDRKRACLLSV